MPRTLVGAYLKNVILDTDMGWDDVISLCLITKNRNINLLGVTVTGQGETHLQKGCELAKRILKAANMEHVPVIKGVKESPLGHRFPEPFREYMDNNCDSKVLEHVTLTEAEKSFESGAAQFMKQQLEDQENQITIISIGGLANVAKLFQLPEVKFENISRIVMMAGAIDVDGNIDLLNNVKPEWNQGPIYATNGAAEWNVFVDPAAAQVVFDNEPNVPLVMVPLDVDNYVTLDKDTPQLITSSDIISRLIKDVLIRETGVEGSIPIFDPMATMVSFELLRSLRYERRRVTVNLDDDTEIDNQNGKTYGMEADYSLPDDQFFKNISIVKSVSTHEFKKMFALLANFPSRPITSHKKKNVAILVFDNCELFDFASIFEVFGAGRFAVEGSEDNFAEGEPCFNVYAVGATEKVRMNCGTAISKKMHQSNLIVDTRYTIHEEIKECDTPDVVVVIGGQGIDNLLADDSLRNKCTTWIKKYAENADYNIGGCSGVLLMAHTGILNGLDVTTHHTRFQQLHDLSRANGWNMRVVDSRNGRNYVHNPTTKNMTAGGVHCLIAVALHICDLYYGRTLRDWIANEVLEYEVPFGDFDIPAELNQGYPFYEDPRLFLKGFSHLNVVMADKQMLEKATEFYFRVLGFQTAWSVWLLPEATRRFARDAGFTDPDDIDKCRVFVRFLVHPNLAMHIELMYYSVLKGKPTPTFLNTNDAGGFRHVALEVSDSRKAWRYLKKQPDVDILDAGKPPVQLKPDAQTFFYFRDPFGCQWEFEQGREVSHVIKGVTN